MPKILILFAGDNTSIVDAVAEGARAVRFSEVEVRRVGSVEEERTASHVYPTLAGVDELLPYDAIIVGSSSTGELRPEISTVLSALASTASRTSLQNKVGSAFLLDPHAGGSVWPSLAPLGDMGMVVVAPSGADAEAARALGGRVAQVVGWVTHARSHHHHSH